MRYGAVEFSWASNAVLLAVQVIMSNRTQVTGRPYAVWAGIWPHPPRFPIVTGRLLTATGGPMQEFRLFSDEGRTYCARPRRTCPVS
jgi:hypothetical protein